MSIGAVLVGIGALVVVVAYVARPFRIAMRNEHLDRAIEAWVAQAHDEGVPEKQAQVSMGCGGGEGKDEEETSINFCPRCGRQAAPGDRFCSGCGAWLREGAG